MIPELLHYGMFVRWQSRERTRDGCLSRGRDVHLLAVLVEAVRVDGRPRQKHVAVLASIYERERGHALAQAEFWERVAARLDRLGNRMTAAERKHVETMLARKVARPTVKQREAARRRADKARARWVARLS